MNSMTQVDLLLLFLVQTDPDKGQNLEPSKKSQNEFKSPVSLVHLLHKYICTTQKDTHCLDEANK